MADLSATSVCVKGVSSKSIWIVVAMWESYVSKMMFCVYRDRIIRAFLIEEQKIVVRALKAAQGPK